MIKTYRIFLASSFRMEAERKAFEIEISRLNKKFAPKNVLLETVLWEDLDSSVDPVRKQNFYNEQLKTCHVLVVMFWGELGIFTNEEYLLALELLRQHGLPKIHVFEKTNEINFDLNSENVQNLAVLKAQLKKENEEQWPHSFDNTDNFLKKFSEDFERRFTDPNEIHFIYGQPAKTLSLNNPNPPTGFLGREEELRVIREKLDSGGKLMLINAEGGIGKTTLAAKYWHESLHNYKHAAWLFCESGIVNSIRELAPALNVDLSEYQTEETQLEALKRALREVEYEFLLVLDNANNEEHIRTFRQTFEGFHWHVLITSRCQGVLDASQELSITHLPPPLAKELFERYYKEETTEFDALLDRVLKAINYHTLLTEVFANNLKKARRLSLKEFLYNLENKGLFLGEDNFRVETSYNIALKAGIADTDTILRILYDVEGLNKVENEKKRWVLVNLALLPAESYSLDLLESLLSDGSKDSLRVLDETLENLFISGWIGGVAYENYRLSPVIQQLVLADQKNLLQDAQMLIAKLDSLTDASDGYNLSNLTLQEAAPYVALIGHLSNKLSSFPNEAIASLLFNCGVYYSNKGNVVEERNTWQSYQSLYQQLLQAKPNDLEYKNGLAISYSKLGGIFEATGDWKNALLNHQEDFRITKEIYESSPENLSYKNGLAISYSKLGGIFEATGDWKNALVNYQERNRISKEIYESSPENLSYKNGLSISYEKLGGIFEATGDWKNALVNYQEYNRLALEIYESSPENLSYKNGLAISYSKLGGIFEAAGDWKNALLNYQEQLRIFKEIYERSPENLSYKNGLAISHLNLGNVFNTLGNWKNGLVNYQEQNRVAKEIYESSPENLEYKNGLAISYSKLGDIFQATGDWKNALLNYQEDLRITKEIYESSPENLSYKNGLAASYAKLGTFYLKQNQLGEALQNFLESRTLFKELWQATEGNIVDFTCNFAWSTQKATDVIKQLIENGNYPTEQIPDITESIKAMRREGFEALKPLYDGGLLQENQKRLYEELGDEGWYGF